MARHRVYLPASWSLLRALREDTWPAAPLRAHAVTDALRASRPDADDEELEFHALLSAALDSVGLIAGDDPPRRVVVAADVASYDVVGTDLAGDPDVSAVSVPVAPRRADLAALHLDDPDAEAAGVVAAARQAWGTPDQVAALDATLDLELGWYALSELDDLLDG